MKKRSIKIIISLILFIISLIIPFKNIWINRSIFLISYIIVGFEIIKKAVRNILKGKILDENFLMTIATIGAFAIGEFPEGTSVMIFYQIGEWFQDYAVDKSRKSISNLIDIMPDYANLLKNGEIIKVDLEEIKVGDTILVKPGEKIPLDGIVIEGSSNLDTKAITGESIPQYIKTGDRILSGCINIDGILKIKVEKEMSDSTASRILELVENASARKSKSENFITEFAKYYTPIVVITAVLLVIIPTTLTGFQNFSIWLYRALSFLVVSCPCALVISIPLSFFGGIGAASKNGILIKGSNYIEALSKSEIAVFDKTGTLTKGVFEVQKIENNEITKDEILRFSAHAENYSNHPMAKSIKKAYGKEIDNNIISNVTEIAGHGIFAIIDGKEVLIGNEKLMKKNKIDYNPNNDIGTIVYIALDKKYAGSIQISDNIKEDSIKAVNALKKKLNFKKIVMLTRRQKGNFK